MSPSRLLLLLQILFFSYQITLSLIIHRYMPNGVTYLRIIPLLIEKSKNPNFDTHCIKIRVLIWLGRKDLNPRNGGVRVHCLTTWRRPNFFSFVILTYIEGFVNTFYKNFNPFAEYFSIFL